MGENLRTSKHIPACFIPEEKLVKSSMDGRVFYEDVDMSFLTGEDMRSVGELLAREFPDFEIWVTGGPYRGYDVKYQVDKEAKIISLDFYSPRPGLQYMNQIIAEIKADLKKP